MSSAITIAAVGAGVSYMNGQQAGKAAKSAADAQQRQQQADLAFRQQQYDRYLGLYGPIEEQLAARAKSSQPLYYDENAAKIKENYAQSMRNLDSAMGMRGIAGSGLDVGGMRGLGLAQAGALSGAWAQGLRERDALGMNLTGRGDIARTTGQYENGMQNMANLYGNQAAMYGGAAQQAGQAFGQNLGNLGTAISNAWNRRQADKAAGVQRQNAIMANMMDRARREQAAGGIQNPNILNEDNTLPPLPIFGG